MLLVKIKHKFFNLKKKSKANLLVMNSAAIIIFIELVFFFM